MKIRMFVLILSAFFLVGFQGTDKAPVEQVAPRTRGSGPIAHDVGQRSPDYLARVIRPLVVLSSSPPATVGARAGHCSFRSRIALPE